MKPSVLNRRMKNGVAYRIEPCVEADTEHTQEFLKLQIADGFERLSTESRWQRFASPISRLSNQQLDYLTRLDGRERVAWCASVLVDGRATGIGLARYIRLPDDEAVAEFAITVVDAYQGQGVGHELLLQLITSACDNRIHKLQGYILPSNRRMLKLCQHFRASLSAEGSGFMVAEIATGAVSA